VSIEEINNKINAKSKAKESFLVTLLNVIVFQKGMIESRVNDVFRPCK